MPAGRPRLPDEVKKMQGTYQPSRSSAAVQKKVQSKLDEQFRIDIRVLDEDPVDVFGEVIERTPWLAQTDVPMVMLAREQYEIARELRALGKLTAALSAYKELRMTLNLLGLSPSARAQLGISFDPDVEARKTKEELVLETSWDDNIGEVLRAHGYE